MLDWLRSDPKAEPVVHTGQGPLPVAVRRHPTAKRMTLRLAPDGSEARVTIPRWGRTADALSFAQSRTCWLTEQLAAMPTKQSLRNGSSLCFRGAAIVIDHRADLPRKPICADGIVSLGGPETSLQSRLKRWLESEARALLAEDLSEYCECADLPAPRLALSSAQRRWGSCSPDGSIRINWRLVMAPDFVRRSVVAHEVAHLLHFDHSPRFHAALARIYDGDMDGANAWLKREGRTLYGPFG